MCLQELDEPRVGSEQEQHFAGTSHQASVIAPIVKGASPTIEHIEMGTEAPMVSPLVQEQCATLRTASVATEALEEPAVPMETMVPAPYILPIMPEGSCEQAATVIVGPGSPGHGMAPCKVEADEAEKLSPSNLSSPVSQGPDVREPGKIFMDLSDVETPNLGVRRALGPNGSSKGLIIDLCSDSDDDVTMIEPPHPKLEKPPLPVGGTPQERSGGVKEEMDHLKTPNQTESRGKTLECARAGLVEEPVRQSSAVITTVEPAARDVLPESPPGSRSKSDARIDQLQQEASDKVDASLLGAQNVKSNLLGRFKGVEEQLPGPLEDPQPPSPWLSPANELHLMLEQSSFQSSSKEKASATERCSYSN